MQRSTGSCALRVGPIFGDSYCELQTYTESVADIGDLIHDSVVLRPFCGVALNMCVCVCIVREKLGSVDEAKRGVCVYVCVCV